MTVLTILQYPNPRLRTKASPVVTVDGVIKSLIADMFETMIEAKGIGLAATQIDVHQRIIVMDLSDDNSEPRVFINPEIEILDETTQLYDEGCLSVPGFYETVSRPRMVKITAQDSKGEKFELVVEDILATCIQHEIDHLDGKLFVDYLSILKRQRIRSKLEKEHKKSA